MDGQDVAVGRTTMVALPGAARLWVCQAEDGVTYRASPRFDDQVSLFRGPALGDQIEAVPLGERWLEVKLRNTSLLLPRAGTDDRE